MQNIVSVLKKAKPYSTFNKSFAIRVLTHVVGDMHQPLHNIELFSKAIPKGDYGGNDIKVTMNVDQSKLKYPLVDVKD